MKRLFFLCGCFIILFAAGCGPAASDPGQAATEYRYTVTDYEGTVLSFSKPPQRILTLSLGFDVMTLGVVPPERMAAVNIAAEDPGISCIVKESEQIPVKLRSYPFEAVLKLKPDLIIASTWTDHNAIDGYREMGFPVLVCKGPDTLEEVKESIRMIAAAVGEKAAGESVVCEMEKQMKEIEQVLKRQTGTMPTVMLVSQMTSYGGKGCMFDEFCQKARVCNGISKVGLYNGQYIPKELVVAADPDFFLVSAPRKQMTKASRTFQQEYVKDPALQGLKGLEHIYYMPDRYLYNATQHGGYAVKAIANAAYGNIFDMSEEHLIKGY